MALIDDIRLRLRLSNTAYDTEVNDLIEDAKADLLAVGLKTEKMAAFETNPDSEPLIKNAIAFYVKANFGYDNPDYEGLLEAYEMRKQKLWLDVDDIDFYAVDKVGNIEPTQNANAKTKSNILDIKDFIINLINEYPLKFPILKHLMRL